MRLKLTLVILVSLLLAFTCGEQHEVPEEGGVNPCDTHKCPEGEMCTMVVNTRLLQVPVAHCVEDHKHDDDNSPCQQYTVGSNILSCKSEDEWRSIGVTQCVLRGSADVSELVEVEVQNVCHNIHPNSKTKFLTAKFTCCRHDDTQDEEKEEETTTSPATTRPSSKPVTDTSAETEGATSQALETNRNHGDTSSAYMIPVALSFIIIVIAMAVLFLACRKRRRRRTHKAPSLTFIINPSSEGLGEGLGEGWSEGLGEGDTSLLITNKHSSQGK